jgi:hypothetical protein
MRFLFGIWTIAVALTVSAVAAYYSIIGLTAIFAAAVVPIIIMGASLEVAKITTAVWLHTYWSEAPALMRAYLTSATVVLMLITSMGIFGFLSKAHIEQSAGGSQLSARIERISQEIGREEQTQRRAEVAIAGFTTATMSTDAATQERIATQERLITGIEQRLARDIEAQNALIAQELVTLAPLQQRLADIEAKQASLLALVNASDTAALQLLVGAKADGVAGPETQRRVEQYKIDLETQRQAVLTEITAAQQVEDPEVTAIRVEIQRLQQTARADIARAQAAIDSFSNQLVTTTAADNSADVAAQEATIAEANKRIDALLTERFELENQLRTLEAEVGPVKYLAELIYGAADQAVLEQSVRWVIIVLVLVFDPLALVLVLAGISLLPRKEKSVDFPVDIPHNDPAPPGDSGPTDPEPVSDPVETADQPDDGPVNSSPRLQVIRVPRSVNLTDEK